MIAFGPVPSRRLGLSLGINNIVSLKDCSYSCIYCQIGATRDKTKRVNHLMNPESFLKRFRNTWKSSMSPINPII